ncbi:uncharacterized protein EV420DRAFT_1487672 [Desarmillaria tabescens]|uniref:Uncharacterized protein n=1 Tax=Armillaria tabescens TaxID=1929756 RepID=A0AA39J5L4_ARMTA|nr:uncharacterized protein EV420DRAFT_1487672 [Desarmillaria tabescens]KAK0436079.1 hypothetical protein EV420DRAFT_1487672 [Desarmillaria tabescens]
MAKARYLASPGGAELQLYSCKSPFLFAELDGITPDTIPSGASLSVPAGPLPLPEENEEAPPPTFPCGACGFVNNVTVHKPFKWYAVIRGWAVGVVQGSSDSTALTTGVTAGHASKGSTKKEAITIFNQALSKGQVTVVPKMLKI